ncbi:hypothetical protein BDE36_4551 [Arcticibacter tournemirensis]|nr:hypothetical protein BDE36_4551 [Arcticibacter tournemirensis]
MGQSYFRVVDGVPHLPFLNPSSVVAPEPGMLIYSTSDLKPMIYTGTGWDSFCTNTINATSTEEYFVVKKGIPCLPSLNSAPVGSLKPGTVYYSVDLKAFMVYNGGGWNKLAELVTGSFTESSGFTTGLGVKTCKLPVLNSDPIIVGLSVGAMYINSASKSLRYYNGSEWKNIECHAVVKTLPVTDLAAYTATSGSDVLANGGSPVTLTGICWSTNSDPDTATAIGKTRITTTGTGLGVFPSQLKDLLPKTTYYIRAYAVNDKEIVYGENVVITTPIAPPTIITLPADSITSIRARSGGDITSDGGAPVTKRGIIWSATGDPLNDPSHIITDDGSGVGPYPSTLEGLLGNTKYYVRAYAVNAAGKAYGNLVEFTTPPPVPPVLNPTITITDITGSSATGTALILNNGGAIVTERGLCYSTDGVNYIYVPSSTVTPTDIGTFITNLTGLLQGTTYYVKGYAKNIAGIGYSSETSFVTASYATIITKKPGSISGNTAMSGGDISNSGFSVITTRGICWDTTKIPTIDLATKTSDPVNGDGTGSYTSKMINLLPGVTYYVRAYAVNKAGTAYGNLDSLVMPDLPKVTTSAASFYQTTTITGGNVLDDGGAQVTERGICWSTTFNPTISNSRTVDGDGLGLFTSIIPGLTPNITYHIRAYARNSVGVGYGEDLTFTINPDAPVIITLDISDTTSMSAVSGGNITSRGSAVITLRGLMFSTKGDPANDPDARIVTNDGSGEGIFPSKMENLLGNTTYYVRAYAANKYGKSLGDLKVFTTLPPILPTVYPPSFDINYITNTSAVGEFLVKNNGGDPVTERGIRYSTDRVNYTYVASENNNTTDIGTFIANLTGLTPNTTYYAQAYAINSVGTGLSAEASFRTTSLAILNTIPPYDITGFEAYSGGEIFSTGDDIITVKGVCWSTQKNPTVDLATKTSEPISGIGTGIYTSHITGLTPGVKYYVRAYAINSFGVAYGNLDSLTTSSTAFITTMPATSVTSTTAMTGGHIQNDGNQYVTSRGVCWGTSPNPTTSGDYIENGAGTGTFNVKLINLMGSTKYYIRAYAINSVGIGYGNLDSFKTAPPVIPSVTTTDVVNIGGTSATGRGNVTGNGGALVNERGFCWNTTGNPDINGDHAASGSGTGAFSGGLTGLTPNTKYYVRAYAINDVGIAYGNEVVFSTFTTATVLTLPVDQISSTGARGGGNIISDGGAAVTESGICWNTTGNPNVYETHTGNGIGIGQFLHNMGNLMGSTVYYVRAYAINSAGIAYGQVETFTTNPPIIPTLTTTPGRSGVSGTTALCGGIIVSNGGGLINTEGIVYSTAPGFIPDTVVVNKTVQAGSGNFSSTLKNLKPGTTYYARAYAVNSAGIGYASNEVSFTTFDLPIITTIPPDPASITNVAVKTGGNIVSNGGTDIIESGICWSTENTPTTAGEHISNGPGSGSFVRTLTELMGSTTYYVRAYAINSVGTAYGQVESFTTRPPVLATIVTTQPVATSSTTATSGGTIVSHGGALVTTRGIYWSTQPNFIPDTINRTAQPGYYTGSFTANLTGLTPNTVYYVKAYVVNSVGVAYGEEMSFKSPTLPTITTAYASADGPTKATSGGNITDNGGAEITSRGVVWSTDPNFNQDTVIVNRINNGGGSGSFVSKLTELKGSTTYYIMAYARNIAGTSYGNLLSFITDPPKLATLTTREAWNVYGLTTSTGGHISDNGGEPVTTRGVIWSTTKGFNPDTVVNNKTVQTGTGIGYFTSGMTGLTRGTTYYVRAYAINSVGIAYASNEISFTTLDLPKLTTKPASPSSTGYAATSGGVLISDGGTSVTNQGVCWSTNPNPTTNLYTKTTYDSWSGNNFFSSLTNLSPVTKYYVRAYAVNNQGTAYGDEVSFTTPPALPIVTTSYATPISKSSVLTGGQVTKDGGAEITQRGVIWSTDANFNPDTVTANKTVDGQGIGKFNSTITNMELSISYYIRAYATNSAGTAYGNQVTVTIFPTSPILNTIELTEVTGTTVKTGGEITSDGGAPVTLKGICWATHTNPTVDDSRTYNGDGTDTYLVTLSGLKPNTLYYVRAYAINKIGTAYGIERTFQTNGIPTLTATTPVTNIIATTATSGGEVTDDGRSRILARGIVWSRYSNPDISLTTKTVDTTVHTIGSFIAKMKGLSPNTTYYVRAYASNAVGTGYGSQVQFTTLPVMLPTLITIPPFDVDSIKATSGGDVTDDGGMPILSRGIIWGTTKNLDINTVTKLTNSVSDTGYYTNQFTGLSPGTKYYVKAFAINSKGTAYGNLDSLTTKAVRATLSNVVMSNLTNSTGDGTASVIADGGAAVTERGICWNTTGNPTIADDTIRVGSGKGSFTANLKGLIEQPTYYVRAYAVNSAGVAYSSVVTSFKICPSAFDVIHVEGLNGAPVSKTVTYHSISTNISGKAACWLTQNLGADKQAVAATDATEPAAGWYWQYNRIQGYQYTTVRYPLTWVPAITEDSDWKPENDPCSLLIGTGWRIPTTLEWTNADGAPQNWNNYTNTFNSELKLHAAGYLDNGGLVYRGSTGEYWTSNQATTANGGNIGFNSTVSYVHSNPKARYAFSLRCIRDSIVISKASVSNVVISDMTSSSVKATATVAPDGGAEVTERGFCWNTTGDPQIADNQITMGAGTGSFTSLIDGLKEGPTYYIRAYAVNAQGTSYSPIVTSFKICPPEFIVQHVEGLNGAPVSKTVTYHSVSTMYSGAARCWITQNLGADQQATVVNDATETSAGWYWQFNRPQGYKYTSARSPATTWTSLTQTSDWVPENDPCNLLLGSGWRIPTSTEYANVIANGGIPFTTPLKLHNSGYLNYADGSLAGRGTYGIFWSSTATAPTTANYLQFSSGANAIYSSYKWHGFTLRCLRDTVVMSKPSVSKVTFSEMTSTAVDATAIVTPDGGSPVTERGFCWNTTGDPTTSDNKIASGDGLGSFTKTLSGLKEGPTYYVRAYATNSIGTGYSTEASSFKICPPEFTVQHIEGIDGAAATKSVTYHSVSSTLSGQAACWLTQNLGADQQATSLADATDASAGWYWQFNRTQAYQYGGAVRTPLTGWFAINETRNWTSLTDPCTSLLGSGWRIPTNTEWTNVISNGGLPFASSPLKLHYSGYLNNTTGVLAGRGTQGNFWSSVQTNTTTAYDLPVYSSANPVLSHDKAYAFSVRCLRDSIKISLPSVGSVTVDPFTMTATTADVSAAIGSDGGAPVTARGFCWNTTGSPTLADQVIAISGGGTGAFAGKVTGLKEGDVYYIRAYATNSAGTAYSDSTGFNAVMTVVCPASFDIQHTAGVKGAPVTKKVTYHATGTYMTGAARCWITQNLGADREATSVTDATEPSAGWYFQFNRMLGYQYTTARTPIAWMTAINEASDWAPVNDPCNNMLGVDWRMPTYTEWLNVDGAPQNWTVQNDAYNSVLKLHNAGYLAYNTGALGGRGTQGNYWSSTRNSTTAGWDLQFYNAGSAMIAHDKAYGFSVRCLRDAAVKMPPTLSNVVISTTTMTDSTAEAIASIVTNGGSPVTARGIVWNTTGYPTINDNKIPSSSTDSTFNGVIEGLKEGPTYYVRAYAENSIGLNYSPQVTTFKICPQEFEILHSAGFNGSPVTKKVKYHSVNSTLSGSASCWLTQNLGADQIAGSATDASEASAGWYWQFNRVQGYKHDGTVLTPSTGWVTTINESLNWTSATDPCNLLLSTGWRIPTATEWTNAVGNGGWSSKNAYASELKLHYGGQLKLGALSDRGSYGMFWSATQASTTSGSYLEFSAATGVSKVASYTKADRGWSLRCIRDALVIAPPQVSNVTITKMTDSLAIGTATVTPDGGAPVTKRGLVWNATGSPTVNDNVVAVDTTGLGDFTAAINGLEDGKTYYVRAFATNSAGTGYSPTSVRFKICKPIDAIHVAGLNGAPENKTVKYNAISTEISGALMCWITQNLGSDRQALAVNDDTESSSGWYWQFNRSQGYKHDGTSYSPKNGWTAWTTSISEWNVGWAYANDPCGLLLGSGWRLPTSTEWSTADAPPQNWNSSVDAYKSVLKLHLAGYLTAGAGALTGRGTTGYYWSNSFVGSTYVDAYAMLITGTSSSVVGLNKANATPVRCVRDAIVPALPSVSNVSIPTSTMTDSTALGTATVAPDGGSAVTDRGLCWSTSKAIPTIADNIIKAGTGIGTFTSKLEGLVQGTTYYVRAYATNGVGTAYSPVVSSFKICPTEFTVIHTEGLNGAPEDKTVTYHSISSGISKSALCWLTQNLGSSQEASGATDASEASSGWYWQFNRSQGYKHDGTNYSPKNAWTAWVTSISEWNVGWAAGSDPCILLLGSGWRLPTATEWDSADDAPQFWQNYTDTYKSVLKLHAGGYLTAAGGVLTGRGTTGYYWSSSFVGSTYENGYALGIGSGSSGLVSLNKANATPVRCVRDAVVINLASVSNVDIPTSTMTSSTAIGTATAGPDGGASITERGLCWSTTNVTPTVADNKILSGSGVGTFNTTISGLTEGPTVYVRAYVINSKGVAYSPSVTSFKICLPLTVTHVGGLNGAPETKTITYGTISSNIGGFSRCWITQNLGSDRQALAVNDDTESSSGWYWQFNRSQGYKHDGTSYSPKNGWTAWTTSISEWNVGWAYANDPCGLLLGSGWRLPTSTEWSTADAPPQNWNSSVDAYKSVLKLHLAGYLTAGAGALTGRGTTGYYWSNSFVGSTYVDAYAMLITGTSSSVVGLNKANATPVRCVRDAIVPALPSVSNVSIPTSTMTDSTALGTATVAPDGGSAVTDRGLCWSTSKAIPTIADNIIKAGTGIGTFTSKLEGLVQGTTYYVRAYATNGVGTAYSPVVSSFKICPTEFTVIHTEGLNGAPEDKTVTYHSISSGISKSALCWLTQNLGSSQEASGATDASEASSGWYWQFNRSQGYKHDGTNYSPKNAWTAWVTSISEWNVGWAAGSDPCILLLGSGWRLPTATEWDSADDAPQFWQNYTDTYKSVLKLHAGGYLTAAGGVLTGRGTTGYYWSSSFVGSTYENGYALGIGSGSSGLVSLNKANATPVRCVRDAVVINLASVSNVDIPTSTMTSSTAIGTATAGPDGGASITERGLCWSTTNVTPTIADNKILSGSGVGTFNTTISGLTEGPTVYVRAYVINSKGVAYSPSVTSFKICLPLTVTHVGGLNGAPETKTITYGTISSNIGGFSRCWITQNLGSDRQALAVNDDTESSSGWYWQFNRSQGYKHDGTSYSPKNGWTAWTTSISEWNVGWAYANDPCGLLLGSGWRLPTSTEWSTADAPPQNWNSSVDAYKSVLKLHLAGYLTAGAGALTGRGTTGYYWSNSFVGSTYVDAYAMLITGTSSSVVGLNKANATPVRCVRDAIVPALPSVSNVSIPTSTMTDSTALGTATVAPDGGSAVTDRGLCWSTSKAIPTIADNIIKAGTGIGTFTSKLEGLVQGTTYYVRAYATNGVGTAYSPVVSSFKICPTEFTVIHTEGLNGAPEDKTVTYHSISSGISKSALCWLTQNLGSSQEASGATDASEASSGWYWQFNRSQGYKHDGTNYSPKNAWTAWVTSISEWNVGWAAGSDPCILLLGSGWRLPTATEWDSADDAPQFWQNYTDTYKSVLKLHAGGYLTAAGGVLTGRGTTGYYWSSSFVGSTYENGYALGIGSGSSGLVSLNKANATPVRCVRDAVVINLASVSNVDIPTSTMTSSTAIGTATAGPDGGASITERGLCWSTTNVTPTVADNKILSGSGVGTFNTTISGLTEGPTVYVRAYVINSKGVAYSPSVTSFKICPTEFNVIHTEGLNGSPESKTITYHSISSGISKSALCWLTQNLGAEKQATSVTDASALSSGWYWQFNQLQGYKHDGTSYSPKNGWTPWITSISEWNVSWASTNDPCVRLLSSGWRLPTVSEWVNADDAPQFWLNYNDAFGSVLKLHAAGYLTAAAGALTGRGATGYYWSNSHVGSTYVDAYAMLVTSNSSSVVGLNKANATPVRCVRDALVPALASVSSVDVPTITMTGSSAKCTAIAGPDGGVNITERGFCWSTTNPIPAITDNKIMSGLGVGSFTETISGLNEGVTVYVRAYVMNSKGTSYSPSVSSFKICLPVSVIHEIGINGAPESKSITYQTISTNISGLAKCWITQNLGSAQPALSVSDATESSSGWYWQFNRLQGYKHDGNSYIPVRAWITSISEWNVGWAASIDPCTRLLGNRWRLPTYTEFYNADDQPQYWQNAGHAFNSVLRLHPAGYLAAANGALVGRGVTGYYWTSSYVGSTYENGYALGFGSGSSSVVSLNKAIATPLRCLKD